MNKPLSRRTVLRAAGVSLALPLLDAMVPARAQSAVAARRIPRSAFVYFPHGVNNRQWTPNGEGRNWQVSPTLKQLEPLKQHVTVLTGLGHPNGKGGHEGADLWLTGAALDGTAGRDYANSISVDQVAAKVHGLLTRVPSLELSALSGPGRGYHTHTLAFNDSGAPIPGENRPRAVFERLFVDDRAAAKTEQRRRIANQRSVLDVVLGQARSLDKRLGSADRAKLDQYYTSIREVERRVIRRSEWIDRPKPTVKADGIALDVQPFTRQHDEYLRAMFDLMALAFQTDTTRVATFMMAGEASIGRYDGAQVSDHHGISHHGGDPDMLEGLARVDRFLIKNFTHFLTRLHGMEEAGSSMLDHTMVLYGSGMNNGRTGTHSPKNLPLLLAGGSNLGVRQGQHLRFAEDSTPLCNVYLTMLQRMGLEVEAFSDSAGTLNQLT